MIETVLVMGMIWHCLVYVTWLMVAYLGNRQLGWQDSFVLLTGARHVCRKAKHYQHAWLPATWRSVAGCKGMHAYVAIHITTTLVVSPMTSIIDSKRMALWPA